ncbi:MAG TPA: hypothetical protein VFY18_10860 [Candidatus Limnocylindrales bacterium]|nr:hypothetical protein [Candidatus Limnocylindrales bacterium]
MNHDHDAVRIHRAELDHEIDTIRTERLLAAEHRATSPDGLLGRARQRTGRALITAGTALVGGDRAFTTRRA